METATMQLLQHACSSTESLLMAHSAASVQLTWESAAAHIDAFTSSVVLLVVAFFPNGWQYGHTSWTRGDDLIQAQGGPL